MGSLLAEGYLQYAQGSQKKFLSNHKFGMLRAGDHRQWCRKQSSMSDDFQIVAKNANAPFTLKLHRGDGMTILAMDWKDSKPPRDFVGFALEYKEPDGDRFWTIKNRINFPNPDGSVNKERT